MEWLDALILGIVQGLSEYLPISSSGHLEIFREILGINLPNEDILEFDVMLHAATVLSTLVVLWNEFFPLCRSFFTIKRDDNFYYVCKILISCIPVAVVGLFFKDTVESFFGGNLTTVGICLCITAALLAFAYFFRTKPEETNKLTGRVYRPRDITWLDAVVIGIAQSIAGLPDGHNPHPWRNIAQHKGHDFRACRIEQCRYAPPHDRLHRLFRRRLPCLQMDAQHRQEGQTRLVCRLLCHHGYNLHLLVSL